VIHLNDFVEGVIEDIINSKPLGLVVLLPDVDDSKLNAETKALWNEAQGTLSSNQLNIPIFFSEETPESKKLYVDLKREANAKTDVPEKKKKRMQASHQFVINGAEPTVVDSLDLSVFFGVF